MGLTSIFREWRELRRFRSLDPTARSIVFYAEDGGSWVHFEQIIRELIGDLGKRICYVTSSSNDPVLRLQDDHIQAFYIGSGSARTVFFLSLQADVMVMTMPDLETYQIKRSKSSVHYVYVYHAIISTHMSYRQGAFDHFDAILCVGPHHKDEIRATETLYGLAPKALIDHGYGRLDSILSSSVNRSASESATESNNSHVLVAPSWGPDSLLETCGSDLIEVLLGANYSVTVRPHPMIVYHRPKLLSDLRRRFGYNTGFSLDLDIASEESLHVTDLMICDWGGVALEYAFGFERPVLFIDVPRKVINSHYQEIACVPLEVRLRSEVGIVASPDHLEEIPNLIGDICGSRDTWKERIRELRSRWIYNVGSSGAAGASYIAEASQRAVRARQDNVQLSD